MLATLCGRNSKIGNVSSIVWEEQQEWDMLATLYGRNSKNGTVSITRQEEKQEGTSYQNYAEETACLESLATLGKVNSKKTRINQY
jgi:hypothetical protein